MPLTKKDLLHPLSASDADLVMVWQVSTFRRRIGYLFAMHGAAALILLALTLQSNAQQFFIAWPIYFIAAWILAALLFLRTTGANGTIVPPARAFNYSWMATIAWSSPWLFTGEMLLQMDPSVRLVAACILILLAAGAAQVTDMHFPATVASEVSILLPTAVFLIASKADFNISLGLVLLAFLCLHLVIGFRFSRAAVERGRLHLFSERAIERLNEQIDIQAGARDKIEKALSLAQQACLDKSRFLAAASHDLRQPMHAISLFVAALKSEAFESRSRYLLERLDRSLAGLDNLFNRLLDISRLDAGLIVPVIKTVDASVIAQTLESRFMPLAAGKSLQLRVRCQRGLQIRTDPELLVELITNLLSNSFRYTEHGGVLLSFRTRAEHVLIQVWDTGCGIPEHHTELIFDEFVQLNNPARDRRKGLGLGLAIVKRLAEALHHPLLVRSCVGRGSMFSVQVPRADGTAVTQLDTAPTVVSLSGLDGSLILVVDDEIDILAAMEALLASWGCHTILARSPEEAYKYVDASLRFPDVIITDHRLADNQTSDEVAEAIHPLLPYEIPMIVISGEPNPSLEWDVNNKGWIYMNKPVNAARLYLTLSRALEKAAQSLNQVA